MTDQSDRVVGEFSANLDQLSEQADELQTVLTRTLKALTQHGVQLSVDLDGLVKGVQTELKNVRTKSQRMVARLEQQRELVRTVALITSSLELSDVLAEVMDTVIQLTGAERAYLMLRSRTSDELQIRAARNWDRETLFEDEVVFSHSIVNAALEQMEPIVATNAQGDARFQEMKSVVQHGLRSIICIPLTLRGTVVGVLYADNRIEQGIFSQDDIPLLTAFGAQAAIAIENARQFGQVKDDLQQTQRELEILKIQIDTQKVQEQVRDITDTAYFEHLAEAARELRRIRDEMRRQRGQE
ncbi:MAG: GAF domain-containing protein [Anaerolineae bacterium]|nr:GAF domain-containing protein [Anaerolineae bacterium]